MLDLLPSPVPPAPPRDETPTSASIEARIQLAAVEVASRLGLARLSMGDVARQAGLSRQTVYRHFASREALIEHAVLAEGAAMLLQAVAALDAEPEPRQALAAAVAAVLHSARQHPLLDRLLSSEPESLLPLVTHSEGRLAQHSRTVVAGMLADRFALAPPAAIARTADLATRLLVSYVLAPSQQTPEQVGHFVANALVAALHGGEP